MKKNDESFLNIKKTDYKIIKSYLELINFLKINNYYLKNNLVFISDNYFENFTHFKSNFDFIIAAGGVVQNRKNEVLMIYKNDIWDLPKGKLEIYEDEKYAAIREVKEETNVKNLEIISDYFPTYHIYNFYSKIILKETKWFLMKTNKEHQLIPQLEEGIVLVDWISLNNIKDIKTYRSIYSVLKFFLKY